MKVMYDPGVDVLRILFRNPRIAESDEDKPGVILDYDKDGITLLAWKYSTPRSVLTIPEGLNTPSLADMTL